MNGMISDTLVARAQEWVDTWNDKDVKRMRRLHADDVSIQLYGIGDEFTAIEGLLKEIRELTSVGRLIRSAARRQK